MNEEGRGTWDVKSVRAPRPGTRWRDCGALEGGNSNVNQQWRRARPETRPFLRNSDGSPSAQDLFLLYALWRALALGRGGGRLRSGRVCADSGIDPCDSCFESDTATWRQRRRRGWSGRRYPTFVHLLCRTRTRTPTRGSGHLAGVTARQPCLYATMTGRS